MFSNATTTIQLDVVKVVSNFTFAGAIKIQAKFGDKGKIETELASEQDHIFLFMENNSIVFPIFSPLYIELKIINSENAVVSQMTVFYKKFKELSTLRFVMDGNQIFTLHYHCKETHEEDGTGGEQKDVNRSIFSELPEKMPQESSLQFFKISILLFNFTQRLDPLAKMLPFIISILTWRHKVKSLLFGLAMTFIIYYFKTSVFIVALIFTFRKSWLIRTLQKFNHYRDNHRRIIVPKENINFLKQSMEVYCEVYEQLRNFLFEDDKTSIIEIIHFVSKIAMVTVVALFLIGLEHSLVLALWGILLLASPIGGTFIRKLKPFMAILIARYNVFQQKFKETISSTLHIKDFKKYFTKEFYFYEYQRWWLLKEWVMASKRYSDPDYECVVIPKMKAPQGWVWKGDWEISFEGDVDQHGFQYANDFQPSYKRQSTMATLRRKKWKRSCVLGKEKIHTHSPRLISHKML